jgi:hypothetical protein
MPSEVHWPRKAPSAPRAAQPFGQTGRGHAAVIQAPEVALEGSDQLLLGVRDFPERFDQLTDGGHGVLPLFATTIPLASRVTAFKTQSSDP